MDINKEKTVCFTGHRPEKMNLTQTELLKIKDFLNSSIRKQYSEGFNTFITGMSRGIDIEAAKIVLELKKEFNDIRLVCAVPFPEQAKMWLEKDKIEYNNILKRADKIETISSEFSKYNYIKRDRWMIDNSSVLIGVYNGDEKSGTGKTIMMAHQKNLKTIIYAL